MGDLFLKDPGAVLYYRVEWDGVLAGGITLAQSSWLVEPPEAGGLAVVADSVDGSATVARLSGGHAGHVYRVCNRAGFSDGSIDERTLVVRVEER